MLGRDREVTMQVSVARPAGVPPFLEVKNVSKSFGGVKALEKINLTIEAGKIYHLMGENGCGKSTLIKIISGAQQANDGKILIDGRPVGEIAGDFGAIGALRVGIETVYQDLSLLPNLSVAENIALTRQLVASRGRLVWKLDKKTLYATAQRALAEVQLPTDRCFLRRRTDSLPLATRQMIAISRAMASEARLVIMDEPTTSLTRREVLNLQKVIERLLRKGVTILFVTHKLDECKSLGGRAIILRDGLKVAELEVAAHSKAEFSAWMTGRAIRETRYRAQAKLGALLLEVENLSHGQTFQNITLTLRQGEILGITGLLDSGRNELALALSGVKPAESGQIKLKGQVVRIRTPAEAIRSGIAYVPEDRLIEGLFLEKPIEDNIVVPLLDRLRNALGIIRVGRIRDVAQKMLATLQILASDTAVPVQTLSGGNQQKVLIGRGLTLHPQLLILHGPTVGVDVGSKETIFRILQRLADQGMGILLISDDLPELLQNCDRILVLCQGRLVDDFRAEGLTEDTLYQSMTRTMPGTEG